MNFKDKSQIKLDLIIRLNELDKEIENNNTDKPRKNDDNDVNSVNNDDKQTTLTYQVTKSLDCLLISSNDHVVNQKVNSLRIFTEKNNNKDIFDYIKDTANVLTNNLVKGFNAALVTYGRTGSGKTHSLFGTDSIYNENKDDFNILTTIYNEMKNNASSGSSYGISMNFLEIWYDETDKSENITDLLEASNVHENYGNGSDFYGLTTVAIRTQLELENLISIVKSRSRNWVERRDLENQIEYQSNTSHFLCKMNFINIQEKKQFSFYLVDLIGFDDSKGDTLEQYSLHQVNKLLDELHQNKDRMDSYKANKYKNMKYSNTKNGNFSAVAPTSLKIVCYLSNIILNSQTLFFFHVMKNQDNKDDMIPIIDRMAKITQVRYSIDKESVDFSKKINIMSFMSFAKAIETYMDENPQNSKNTLNLSTNQTAPEHSGGPFSSGIMSPIYNYSGDKRESNNVIGGSSTDNIYVKDMSASNSKMTRTDSKKGITDFAEEPIQETEEEYAYNTNTNSVDSVSRKLEELSEKAEHIRRVNGLPSQKQDLRSEGISNDIALSISSDSNPIDRKRTGSNNPIKNPTSASGSQMISVESIINSPKSQVTERYGQTIQQGKTTLINSSIGIISNKNLGASQAQLNENYLSDYNAKVKDVLQALSNVMQYELAQASRQNLPAEYYLLKRNYDVLHQLFKEGEEVKTRLANDFVDLRNKIEEFKNEYDTRINTLQTENAQLTSKVKAFEADLGFKEIFDLYEKDIEVLESDNKQLRLENRSLFMKLNTQEILDDPSVMPPEYGVLVKKNGQLSKQYERINKALTEKEQQLMEYKKKERLIAIDKKLIATSQEKISALAKKIETKDEVIKNYTEQIENLKKENAKMRNMLAGKENDIKKISTELFEAMEQASLYKEMVRQPMLIRNGQSNKDYELRKDLAKLTRDFATKNLESNSSTPFKKIPDYNKIIDKLKSLKL